jgi:hypothetical protein
MNDAEIFVCCVDELEGVKDYVTLISPEFFSSHGLCPEAIVGVITRPLATGESITSEVFASNRVFVEFMHDVIAQHGPLQPDFQAEARRLGDGFVYVIDQRTPDPGGSVPPHDIVGSFQVTNGKVVPGSYNRNPNHVILSADRFFSLGPNLDHKLRDEMLACYSR